jgi:hypothetical protein
LLAQLRSMRSHAFRAFAFAPMASAFVEGLAKLDIGAYAFALIPAYPLTILLGIPAYVLLKRRRPAPLWRFIAAGCALGVLSGLLLTVGMHAESSKAARIVLCGLEGAVTATAIWLIAQCHTAICARVQTWLVASIFIGAAGYLLRWTFLYGSLTWLPAVAICVGTAAAIFARPAIARVSILVVAILYAGYWLIVGVPGFIAGFHTATPWQESALAFVPGIGLVLLPAAYCCHVATTYMPRRSGTEGTGNDGGKQ